MIRKLVIVLLLITAFGCQKREPLTPAPGSGPVGIKPPEEPILYLAWKAAQQIQSGLEQQNLPMELKMLKLKNSAGIADDASAYFQAALETRLQAFGMRMPGDARVHLAGSLYWLRDQLVYGLKLQRDDQILFSDSVSIPRNDRLDRTLAQFGAPPERPHEHKEAPIPTPVARIEDPPLDVHQQCPAGKYDPCEIVLLYPDRLVLMNWKTQGIRIKTIPSRFREGVFSRAPSGKILHTADGYILVSNSLKGPLYYDSHLQGPVSGIPEPFLPLATHGINSYSLGDGRFSDFEFLPDAGMVAVETDHHLSMAREGILIRSSSPAGGAVAVKWPEIYTSAPVLPDQSDSVQKYVYRDGNLTFESSRPALGNIVDLAITDLDRDSRVELLVTVSRPEGVFIEVWEAF